MQTTSVKPISSNPRGARNGPPPDAVASPADTRSELLKHSGRGYTVCRHLLYELPSTETNRVGVLGPMVSERERRALQLYLLLLTIEPLLQTRIATDRPPLTAVVYARALSTETGRKWTPSNVSSALKDLESRGLVARERIQHGVQVLPRREDGHADYTRPGGSKRDFWETYFVLPAEFWTDEWFERLTLPGLAMLLIIAGETSSKAEKWLTNQKAAEWYGMSERSVQAGISDLEKHELLDVRVQWVKASLSAIGTTAHHYYSLTGPFSNGARGKLRRRAQAEIRKRTLADQPKSTSSKKAKGKKGKKDKSTKPTVSQTSSNTNPAPAPEAHPISFAHPVVNKTQENS